MKNPWILPAATLVLGVIGGYVVGNNRSSGDKSAAVENAAPKTRSSSRSATASEQAAKRSTHAGGTEAISRMPGISNRFQALMDYYAGLTPEQLAAEARKLEKLPLTERMMASLLLFGKWGEKDPTAAMAFANSSNFAVGLRPIILKSWSSSDPAGAAKYFSANPREFAMMGVMGGGGRGGPGGQSSGASIIAGEWARQDPTAALAWANSLTTDKDQALTSVVSEVAKTDPKKATEMLATMTSTNKSEAYKAVAAQYGANNFTDAQAWIRTLPAEEQAAALASAIGGLSNNDPSGAAKQVALMTAGEAKDTALTSVVGDLARVDPKAAAALLKQQGSDQGMRDGMRTLMPTWVSQDPNAALNYANSLDAGNNRDTALQSYVMSNNTGAPADLAKVAETIGNEGERSRAVIMSAARWMKEDPTAATQYINQSPNIPDNAKQRIISGGGMFGGGRGRGN